MANYESTRDCVNSALDWVGELTDTGTQASEYRQKALDYVNQTYLAILSGSNEFDVDLSEPFKWAMSANPGVLTLLPPETGYVSLTQGSTVGTLSAAPSTNLVGYYLKIDGEPDVFRIASETGLSTTIGLDAGYTGETGTNKSFTAYPLDYALVTNILRLVYPIRVYRNQGHLVTNTADNNGEILGSDISAMLREYPLHDIRVAVPSRFAVKSMTPAGLYTIRVNSCVQQLTRAEYNYIPFPSSLTDSSADIPLIPKNYRRALAYGAAYYLALEKNDNRAGAFLQSIQGILKAMIIAESEQRTSTNPFRNRLIARWDQINRLRFWRGIN